jgi:hypothetical protein
MTKTTMPDYTRVMARQTLVDTFSVVLHIDWNFPNRNVGCVTRTMVRTAHPTKCMIISIIKNAALH